MLSEGPHAGIEVRVLRTDGTSFNEHNIVHLPGRPGHPATTACWLEIEQDAIFSIDIRLHDAILESYHAGAYITSTRIDGSLIRRVIASDLDQTSRVRKVSLLTYQGSEGHLTGRMRFSRLQTAEQLSDTTRQMIDDETSSIQVDIEAGTRGPKRLKPSAELVYAFGGDGGVAHEEKAKRTDSAVQAVNSRPAKERTTYIWYPLDQQRPYHRFVFKNLLIWYRTRAILEYLDIVKPEIPTTSALHQATQGSIQMGQSQNTQSGDGSVASQEEMFKVILDMRRKMNILQRTVARQNKERARERPQVVDLTADDSDRG